MKNYDILYSVYIYIYIYISKLNNKVNKTDYWTQLYKKILLQFLYFRISCLIIIIIIILWQIRNIPEHPRNLWEIP